jgi:hypothetical protein
MVMMIWLRMVKQE